MLWMQDSNNSESIRAPAANKIYKLFSEWPSSAKIICYFFVFFPIPVLFRLPQIIYKTIAAMRPHGGGVADQDFLGFSFTDSLIRPAYTRISRNISEYGPYGYVWHDAFGLEARKRFANNYVTYMILKVLGTRMTNLVGWGLFSATVFLISLCQFDVYYSIVAIVFMGSPVIVFNYTSGGAKTETIWYGFVLLIVYLAVGGNLIAAAVGWSLLCLANFAAPLLMAAVLGIPLLIQAMNSGDLWPFLLAVSPGIIIQIMRFLNGGIRFAGILASFCAKAGPDVGAMLNNGRILKSMMPSMDEVLSAGPVSVALMVLALMTYNPVYAIISIICFVLYYVNGRFFFMSDIQSFDLLFVSIGIAHAFYSKNMLVLAIVVLGALRLRENMITSISLRETFRILENEGIHTDRAKWTQVLLRSLAVIDAYPDLGPIRRPTDKAFMQFFNAVPAGARVAVETRRSETLMRQAYPDFWMRGLWFWTDDILPQRQAELITKEFTFSLEHEFSLKYLTRLSASQMDGGQLATTCRYAGISHVIVFSHQTLNAFQELGFSPIASFDFDKLEPQLRNIFQINTPGMMLLAGPRDGYGIVTPDAEWRIDKNSLIIEAMAGTTYRVRYKYSPFFVARQNGVTIPVTPYRPFDDIDDLLFMQVTAPADGPLRLDYVDSPGRVLVHWLTGARRNEPLA